MESTAPGKASTRASEILEYFNLRLFIGFRVLRDVGGCGWTLAACPRSGYHMYPRLSTLDHQGKDNIPKNKREVLLAYCLFLYRLYLNVREFDEALGHINSAIRDSHWL